MERFLLLLLLVKFCFKNGQEQAVEWANVLMDNFHLQLNLA
jgi:hypothetical protein